MNRFHAFIHLAGKRRLKMKRLFQITTLVVSVAAFSQPALQVVTVNTEDAMAYVSWAQSAAPVFAKINDLPGAIGTCLPGAGAEEEGDAYWWSLAPSHASLLTGSPRDPAVLKEVEKVEDIRTVRERDIWSVVKSSDRVLATGDTYAAWNILVETDSLAEYLAVLKALEAAYHNNGFDDVHIAAYRVNTGDYSGNIMVSSSAPTPERIGAVMDALEEPWAQESMMQFEGMRKWVRGTTLQCQVHVVNQ